MSTQNLTFGTETWTVTAPDDITVSQVSGVLKIAIDYSKASLFGSQAHGIDTITFTPVNNGVDSFNGFKSSVEFDVKNALPVSVSGFDLMLFNNTPASGPLDTSNPTGHPTNYAHFHNTTGVTGSGLPFAPLIVTTFLPNAMEDPDGLAPTISSTDTPPSELRADGTLAPGQTVSAKVMTMHSVELVGKDNTFGINFFPTATPPTSPPQILNVPATTDGSSGTSHPFSTTVVTDTNPLPLEQATITVKDASGALTDSATLLDAGLQHPSVGTYTLPTQLPADLTAALHPLIVNSTGDLTVTLSVDNDGPGGQPPAVASTMITGPAPAALPLTISVAGTPQEGQTLTATTNNSRAVIDWQRSPDGTTWDNIPGATGPTYTLVEADENDQIRAKVSISPSTNATSNPTAKVTDMPPILRVMVVHPQLLDDLPQAGPPEITRSTAPEGTTLTAVSTLTTDADDSVSSVRYQWQRSNDGINWADISGATDHTYTPTSTDDNDEIRVKASFTDDTGQSVTANSDPTEKVSPPPAVKPPHFQEVDNTSGKSLSDPGVPYTGPVQGIDWQWIVPANLINDNLNLTPFTKNVFIATGHGDDAIDVSKTNGTNILDGSTGSNFMTGGTGDDTFFVDDRGATAPIWTTIRGLHSGDDVTIWGLTQSDFQQMQMGNDVLPIAPGLDFALSEKGKPDVNVTLTGLSTNDMRNGKLSINFGHTQDVASGSGTLAGSDYMQAHVN